MVKDGVLTIGNVSAPIYKANEKMKVPDVLFYDNPQVIPLGQPNVYLSETHVTIN